MIKVTFIRLYINHYSKWSIVGSWVHVWHNDLKGNKDILYLTTVQVDESHLPANKGGENISYQKQKKRKIYNMIFLYDDVGKCVSF